ncbi:hypothetical protein PENTCL1PPCAC_15663 [Pristionchus entomophagus]|uniref:glucuronosyltransferase n=1 Tax=Pristionchus entomophagus TaxID=358040 RepID=A0AAV5TFM3_9BILA|nr:hypothetical protein PENTCL1PPCAC_15663 [Pristionchus entomophagus]
MRVFTAVLLLLPCAFSLNLLMYVNVIGKSHLQFAEKLIALLNDHGHNVDVIMGMLNSYVSLKGSYGARNLVVVQFPGESPWGAVAHHLNNPFDEQSDWNRLKIESNKFLDTTEMLCDLLLVSFDVEQLLSTNRYDLALITGYDFCPFALAHYHKISPVVSYVPTPAAYAQTYYAGLPELPLYENIVFDERHDGRSTFSSRIFETLRTFKDRYYHFQNALAINNKVCARFGDDFPDVRDIAMNVSIDFTNSHPLLEEPRPISHRIRYIGGVGLPMPKPLSKELDQLLDISKKGNVIFSFGTQIGPDKISDELQHIFIDTFKRFPEFNFIWKFDGVKQMNATNIFNLDWLPQTDMLYDSRVVAFITHMGLNSFTETAFAGVPVVMIPFFADQVHNARRASAIGIGEIVRKSEITEDNLHHALEKVLVDERYRLRARELSAMISALPDTPQRVFLEGIEFAAKFKHLSSHYRLVGANHNFLVQIGWDVAAFLTVSLLISIYFATTLTIFVLKTLSTGVYVKRKTD